MVLILNVIERIHYPITQKWIIVFEDTFLFENTLLWKKTKERKLVDSNVLDLIDIDQCYSVGIKIEKNKMRSMRQYFVFDVQLKIVFHNQLMK
jgi:hypothetical protein